MMEKVELSENFRVLTYASPSPQFCRSTVRAADGGGPTDDIMPGRPGMRPWSQGIQNMLQEFKTLQQRQFPSLNC